MSELGIVFFFFNCSIVLYWLKTFVRYMKAKVEAGPTGSEIEKFRIYPKYVANMLLERVAREGLGPDGRVVPQQWLANISAPGVSEGDRQAAGCPVQAEGFLGETPQNRMPAVLIIKKVWQADCSRGGCRGQLE